MKTKEKDSGYVDKPFNVRPLCFWALAVGITIVFCFVNIWLGLGWIAFMLVGLFVLSFFKFRDKLLAFFATSKAFFVGTALLCTAVAASFALWNISWGAAGAPPSGEGQLVGVVEAYNFYDDKSGRIIISGAEFNEQKISGRVQVYLKNVDNETRVGIEGGAVLAFAATIKKVQINDYYANNRIKYTASASGDIIIIGQSGEVRYVVGRYAKNTLQRGMDNDSAEVMFSMLFGSKSALDADVKESFSAVGLSHVLAVSGLHVGLVVVLISLVLNFARVRRKYQIPIMLATLLFYCYICGFAFPVVRATIMFSVLHFNRLYLQNTDTLSSISLSAIIILIIFPYSLLSVSFQMSFACMLGIALFMRPIKNGLQRIVKTPKNRLCKKFVNSLVDGMAVYLAVTISMLPFLIKYFGGIPVFGLIANLLFLPIMVLGFQISVVAVVTWIAWPLLYIVNYLVKFVILTANWFAKLPIAFINLSSNGYWYLFYFAGIILFTRFIFMRRRYKYAAAAAFLAVYFLTVLLYSV